jgi:hypothetical protein
MIFLYECFLFCNGSKGPMQFKARGKIPRPEGCALRYQEKQDMAPLV